MYSTVLVIDSLIGSGQSELISILLVVQYNYIWTQVFIYMYNILSYAYICLHDV